MSPDDVFDFLSEELGVESGELAADEALFSSGIVDSFALVTLMMFVEERTGTRINPVDVNLDNFDTVDRIVAFASRASA